ncbi:hypothetical protein GGP41_006361 [Bipolaris sorokiniana]|uniref:Secreted protein n=1 Tax=Cochliobolus sativus TaxID=45130 RepID=A0A8H6DVH5_COCSA|nr:hypothetical protein GGP41_006361 [Bipolaris sorokiniana]
MTMTMTMTMTMAVYVDCVLAPVSCEQRCICGRGGQPLGPTLPIWAPLISGQSRPAHMHSIPGHIDSTISEGRNARVSRKP